MKGGFGEGAKMKQRIVNEKVFDRELQALNDYLSDRKLNDADAVTLLNSYLEWRNFHRAAKFTEKIIKELK